MTAHFAEVAFSFVTAGAAILIVAGLARKGRHLHLFPDLVDQPVVATSKRRETPEKPAISADSRRPRSRSDGKEKSKKQRRRDEKRRERRRAKRAVPGSTQGQSRGE